MNITTLLNNIRDALTSSSAINSWCRANYGQSHAVYKGSDDRKPPPVSEYPIIHLFPNSKLAGEDQLEIVHDVMVIVGIKDANKTTSTVEINDSLVNSTYTWTASGSGTNEFYCELAAGGDNIFVDVLSVNCIFVDRNNECIFDFTGDDPSLNEPDGVEENTVAMTEGILGSLAAGEYGFGDNDTLGYSTVYVRLSDSADPDSKADDYVQTADLVTLVEYDGVDNLEAFRKLVESAITGASLGTDTFITTLNIDYENIEFFPEFLAGMMFKIEVPQSQGDDSFA